MFAFWLASGFAIIAFIGYVVTVVSIDNTVAQEKHRRLLIKLETAALSDASKSRYNIEDADDVAGPEEEAEDVDEADVQESLRESMRVASSGDQAPVPVERMGSSVLLRAALVRE